MARRRWLPISMDDENGPRRRRAVERDIALWLTGMPCAGCGHRARLANGEGCRCAHGTDWLIERCMCLADMARIGREGGGRS